MPWYTNHTPDNHSVRIVHLLSQPLEHLQTGPARLTPVELFLLLSACYLHDIGMQDLRKDGKAPQDFTSRDWDLVREEHPSIVKDWIIRRSRASALDEFRIDLGEEPGVYLELLGLVCQGHGSKFFSTTVEELRGMDDQFDGQRVRGELLTALLMMGDELDINQQRATTPKDENREPTGELHHTINEYSTSVSVGPGTTPKIRRATVQLTMPEDESLLALATEWLGRKLSAQARRVNYVIEAATAGELRFDTRVTFRARVDRNGLKHELSTPARALLLAETQRDRILRGDHPTILRWLAAKVVSQEGRTCVLNCRSEGGRGPLDMLDRLIEQLGAQSSAYADLRREGDGDRDSGVTLAALEAAAAADLIDSAAETLTLLDVRNLDEAAEDTRIALLALIERALAAPSPPLLVLTAERRPPRPPAFATIEFRLEELDAAAISSHLEDRLGYDPASASQEAALLFAVGQGAPVGVLNGLMTLEQRDREVARV